MFEIFNLSEDELLDIEEKLLTRRLIGMRSILFGYKTLTPQ